MEYVGKCSSCGGACVLICRSAFNFFFNLCSCFLTVDLGIWLEAQALATWYFHLDGSLQFMLALPKYEWLPILTVTEKYIRYSVCCVSCFIVGWLSQPQAEPVQNQQKHSPWRPELFRALQPFRGFQHISTAHS